LWTPILILLKKNIFIAEKQSHYSIGIEELEQLAENYDIQFFLVNLLVLISFFSYF